MSAAAAASPEVAVQPFLRMDDPVFLAGHSTPGWRASNICADPASAAHMSRPDPADGAGHLAASPVSAEPQPTAEVVGPQPTAEIADPQPTQPTSELAGPQRMQPIQPMPADLSAVPNVHPDRSAFLEEMFLQDTIDLVPDAQPDRFAFLEEMLDAEDLFVLHICIYIYIYIYV